MKLLDKNILTFLQKIDNETIENMELLNKG